MPYSNYPNGFLNGVTIRGLPILNSYSGSIFWVDSNTTASTANGNVGSFTRPFATIDAAIGACTANNGDIIMVAAGHAETLVAAGAVTMDVAGVSIVGMGKGNNRPVLTFTPAAAGTANVSWTAANCSFENVVCIAGLDALTNPFNISSSGAWLDIEWQDASSTVEAETVVLTTAAADNLTINLVYRGFPAGNACVAPIKLVGATDARINLDFYGLASTAVVNFITTLSTNVTINGYAYNSTDTTGAKLVVDTIGSSLWYASIYAGAAGSLFTGGSAAALASDDVSAIASALLVPTADVATNVNSRDVVGNKTDAAAAGAVSATESLVAYVKQLVTQHGTELDTNTLGAILYGAAGIASFPAAAAPANNVSIAEVLREQYDQADKAVTNTTAVLVNGTTLFTIAGGPIEILSLVARCVTANDATASTLQWSADPTDGDAVTISAASASIANVAAGGMVVFQGTTLATAPLVSASGANIGQSVTNGVVVGAGIITSVVGVGSTTGTWQMHMRYRPLARGVTVS